jgi:hypothetical protein
MSSKHYTRKCQNIGPWYESYDSENVTFACDFSKTVPVLRAQLSKMDQSLFQPY